MADYKFEWHGDKVLGKAEKTIKTALLVVGADLQRKSAEQAPIDTGDLRANCSVSPIREEGNRKYITVGYNLPYARRQHEHVEYRHPKGGKAKYLEDPYKENVENYERMIAEAIRKEIGD